ncbi:LysM peptidoglycan-binding domain-containing protein [Weissella paramesenteroides]|uniref:LysM peptidoglycan-binding domain-containing protein n=1 Tax=Weissella paramesenteroides TaxID=1249 RepID=UPI0020731E32|nr:LysM domain-containing protein [Weissella paramesenteroides]MCM6764812.1 LysM domain-containing protein [Weissella paramesenteroides]MCM6768078.1 LysM domain-containing protein [Weissella paramesenteroides]MCM6768666.1 LysM domain-containing protein [Weissella paramesenteroides]MCM6770751.1 LysM domain-containing protein [Weissella paramesenteroides]MCM6780672.1 LysM domain-containing protein [Weissella paramesenteroides]
MKSRRPSRLKFWAFIFIGYVVLFAIGFTVLVAYGALTNKDTQQTSASTSSSSSSKSSATTEAASSSDSAVDSSTSSKATTSFKKKVTVQQGETGYAIATKYGLTVTQLQNLNPSIDLDNLEAGQTLKVKSSS